MRRILNETAVETLVVDHHLLRDLKWREKIARIFETGKEVKTAAEFLGLENDMLEARRKELFDVHRQDTIS